MKALISVPFLMGMLCCSVIASGNSKFVGEWQTRISPVTGKPSITVNVLANGNTFNGTVVFVNPDGTEIEMTLLSPELKGRTLTFQTNDGGMIYVWRMTLKLNGREGVLHGSDRRPAMRGQSGELVIEEPIVKKR